MDWSTALVLAAITWLDGIRPVQADALVLRRVLGGPWTVATPADAGRTWRLVAWWSPFTLGLVIPPGGTAGVDAAAEGTDEAIATRIAHCRRILVALRALGMVGLAVLVVGLPAAAARFGAWGFVAALGAVLLLSVATSITTLRALTRLGCGWHDAARTAAPLLWPFSAPHAYEVVLAHAVAGAPPLLVARRLLGVAGFGSWIRPQAYDALRGDVRSSDATTLATLIGPSDLAAIVSSPPAHCGAGECYCRRCARVYRAGTDACAECGGLRLVNVPDGRLRLAESAGRTG
jgi:hypothetical protein